MINITLQSQYVLSVFGLVITNTFLTSVIVSALLILASVIYYFCRNSRTNFFVKSVCALIFESLKLVDSVTGDRKLSERIFPLVSTFFLFIVAANLLGLVPGFLGSFYVHTAAGLVPLFKSPNSDLSMTLALALVSVFVTQYFSISLLGLKRYISRFFNFSGPVKFVMGFFELLSEAVRIISFSFRLFGNIFAGEALLLVIAFLVPYVLPVPFMILEVFIGIIQAFIFAVLTLAFIKSSPLRFVGS